MWDDEDFFNLIDDLVDAKWDEPYFLGTLVLHKQNGSDYDVVDGQQRLTALCILIACTRDALSQVEEGQLAEELQAKIYQPEHVLDMVPAKNRLQVKDQAAFNALIGNPGGASISVSEMIASKAAGRRYESARSIFWERLAEMSREKLMRFAKFINKSCTLIYLATDSFEDAFALFTVVNDRGKQLRRIDVLKAYNLDPARIPDAGARVNYAHQWEDMEARLGESRFEDIFHLLRLIYTKDKPKGDLNKEFRDRILTGEDGDSPRPGGRFIEELTKFVDLYDSLFVDKDYLDSPAGQHVEYRTMMGAMVEFFPASEWKACILYFADRFQRDFIYKFVLAVEKVYLEHWVRGIRKDERYATYTKLLKGIQDATCAEEVIDGIEIDLECIREACRAENFYGSGHSKYLLVRAEIVTSELDHAHRFQVRSVEHVLPQNPKPGGLWDSSFSGDEHKELVNTAGNLVLLSKSKNSTAGRKEFDDKKATYLEPRVSDFPRSMQVIGYATWTPGVIRERTESFADIVLRNP